MNLSACSRLRRGPETGTWYRAIQLAHWNNLIQTAYTKSVPSRFSNGQLPGFELLYVAENPQVALFEAQAMLGNPTIPGAAVPHPKGNWVVVSIQVTLQSVVDLTDVGSQQLLDTSAQELTGDWRGYAQRSFATSVSVPTGDAPTQELGAALFADPNIEGFLTVSAKVPYCPSLAIFVEHLQFGSEIVFTHPTPPHRCYVIDHTGGGYRP